MSGARLILAFLGIFLFSGVCSFGVNPQTRPGPPDTSHADSEASKLAMLRLNSIVLRNVDLKKADMPVVLDYLTKKSREFDPEHVGIRFALESSPLPVETPAGWPNGDLAPDRRPLVSLSFPEMPLEFLLNIITGLTDLRYKFVNGGVIFSPTHTEEQRRVNKAVILEKLNRVIVPKVVFEKMDIFNVLDFLRNKSEELDPDHTAINFQAYVPFEKTTPPFIREVSLNLQNVSLSDLLSAIHKQTYLEYTITSEGVFFIEPPRSAE